MKIDPDNQFRSDGRGPELVALVWGMHGSQLIGAEYRNPDSPTLMHVRFLNAQAVMITPDEVIGMDDSTGLVDLGHTAWQASMNPQHLGDCTHVRARFYDEALDVICEGVKIGHGGLEASQQAAAPDGASRPR